MSADDGALVERAKQGDREAFGALVRKHQRRVYATAFHLTGQHSDADDVSQEAFVRAYRGLGAFDGRADFATWLHRIVINVGLNHLRSRRRTGLTVGIDDATRDVASAAADPRATAESRELVGAVLGALAELSPTLRVTLVLAAVEEMPYREIATTLGCPEGTVAWRVNQARRLLRKRLAALAPGITQGSMDEVLRRTKQALGAS